MLSILLSVGGLRFRLLLQDDAKVDDVIRPFVTKPEDERVEIVHVSVFYKRDDEISDTQISVAEDTSRVCVRYHPDLLARFASLRGCMMHIPMSQILLAHDRFFLHASFVTSPWGGVLFTGDSGVGKSTQAELWKKHMGSEIINGDRAIVAKEREGWRAYGSPYAGSSGYYVNQDEPIKAIVLLEQSQENKVVRMSAAEAFKSLFLQVSMDHRQTEQVSRLCELLDCLVSSIPVYRLLCTPDVRAVKTLCKALAEDGAEINNLICSER